MRTQERLCSEKPSSRLIVGSATFTTVESRITMNWATATTARTAFGLIREAGRLAGAARGEEVDDIRLSLTRHLVSGHRLIRAIEVSPSGHAPVAPDGERDEDGE